MARILSRTNKTDYKKANALSVLYINLLFFIRQSVTMGNNAGELKIRLKLEVLHVHYFFSVVFFVGVTD
jgi:hypothetical protein